jgi:putative flippase GtrA
MTGYALQRRWTFRARHRHLFAFPRYLALQVFSCLVSACIADAAITRFGFSPLAMSAVTTLVTGAISFLGSAFWVFADRTFPSLPSRLSLSTNKMVRAVSDRAHRKFGQRHRETMSSKRKQSAANLRSS